MDFMADFDESEMINSAEYQVDPDRATLKFLKGGYTRLVTTTANLADSTADLSNRVGSVESTMVAIERTLLQISNQLGKRPIVAESSHPIPPVTHSDTYVRDDLNRLPMDNRKSLLRKIEMPKFDGTNAYDWFSKVERFFRVGRYSDLDKLDLVALSLDGDVLRWFNWEVNRREFHSWEEFRQRLFRRFGAAPEDSPGNRLFAIKQKETVSAYVTELEELPAQVIEQQTVHKEESITLLQVPVSNLEHSLQFHTESTNVCGNYQAVVGCDALGKEENLFSVLSQASQVWEPGGVLKLKEPVGLVNQKKSRCLQASLFNFKRKKKRIKGRPNQLKCNYASVREDWFNTLSRRESWRKHKHENLQIVSELVGFNLGYFRCHKEYGLARMINWSQVRVACSLLQEILFCQNSLSRNMPSIPVIVAQFKFKHGLETNDGIRDGDIAKLGNLTGDKLQFTSLEDVMVVFKIHPSLRNTRFHSREMKQLVGFMQFQLKHKWMVFDRGKNGQIQWTEMVADPVKQVVLNLVTNDARFGFVSVLSQTHAVHLDAKQDCMRNQGLTQSHKFTVDKFGRLNNTRVSVWRVLCLLGTLFWRTTFKKQKFSKNWWYKFKQSLSRVEGLLLPEATVDVRYDAVGRGEFLIQWQHRDHSENSWLLPEILSIYILHLSLRTSLVFRGGVLIRLVKRKW